MEVQGMPGVVRLVRKAEALAITGDKNTALYEKIKRGVMVRPVPIGGRAVAFPSDELQAVVQARIAGLSETELQALVEGLHERRKRNLAALLGRGGAQ